LKLRLGTGISLTLSGCSCLLPFTGGAVDFQPLFRA
jgi:hypothetical protein